jgi:hypothetical protein
VTRIFEPSALETLIAVMPDAEATAIATPAIAIAGTTTNKVFCLNFVRTRNPPAL